MPFLTLGIEMLDNNPMLSIKVIMAVPPYDINGKGTPTTGKSPMTIAMLINTYKNMIQNISINFNIFNNIINFHHFNRKLIRYFYNLS
jgi:hypothetical protein